MSVDASVQLIHWYDSNARVLPWRARAGERSNPYRVWPSEIMLQPTTVAHARPYFEAFTRRWPTVHSLAAADEGTVMASLPGTGYSVRARYPGSSARAGAGENAGDFPYGAAGPWEPPPTR